MTVAIHLYLMRDGRMEEGINYINTLIQSKGAGGGFIHEETEQKTFSEQQTHTKTLLEAPLAAQGSMLIGQAGTALVVRRSVGRLISNVVTLVTAASPR